MRKLILSLCIIALSGAYVARTAMTQEGGFQALLDRISFRPSEPVLPPLDLDTTGSAGDDLLVPSRPHSALSPPAAASDTALALLEPPAAISAPTVPSLRPTATLPQVPRLSPAERNQIAAPLSSPSPASGPAVAAAPVPFGKYRDGTCTGSRMNADCGLVEVRAHVQGGTLASSDVLTYPSARSRSREISGYALPALEREVGLPQDADVAIVSGATLTTRAYLRSLGSALGQAS